jgi:hypothetical protein
MNFFGDDADNIALTTSSGDIESALLRGSSVSDLAALLLQAQASVPAAAVVDGARTTLHVPLMADVSATAVPAAAMATTVETEEFPLMRFSLLFQNCAVVPHLVVSSSVNCQWTVGRHKLDTLLKLDAAKRIIGPTVGDTGMPLMPPSPLELFHAYEWTDGKQSMYTVALPTNLPAVGIDFDANTRCFLVRGQPFIRSQAMCLVLEDSRFYFRSPPGSGALQSLDRRDSYPVAEGVVLRVDDLVNVKAHTIISSPSGKRKASVVRTNKRSATGAMSTSMAQTNPPDDAATAATHSMSPRHSIAQNDADAGDVDCDWDWQYDETNKCTYVLVIATHFLDKKDPKGRDIAAKKQRNRLPDDCKVFKDEMNRFKKGTSAYIVLVKFVDLDALLEGDVSNCLRHGRALRAPRSGIKRNDLIDLWNKN